MLRGNAEPPTIERKADGKHYSTFVVLIAVVAEVDIEVENSTRILLHRAFELILERRAHSAVWMVAVPGLKIGM